MRTQREQLERLGFQEFEAAHYARAEEAFRMAAIVAPESPDAWLGLGASLAKQERHEEAAVIFCMAAIAEPEDAWPVLLAAEAWLASGDGARAKAALEHVGDLESRGSAKQDQIEAARELASRIRTVRR